MPFAAQHIRAGRLHLQKADPTMKKIIKLVGPFTAKTQRDRFRTLVNSIVSQQISGAAAATILGRLEDAVKKEGLKPESLLKFDVEKLREIGVSRQKATYILDLANQVKTEQVNLSRIGRKNDLEIIKELTQIKGIGVWTAQMFLMFSLGRLDVFPDGDLGIQQAISRFYGDGGDISKDEMHQVAERWQPYSTIASWYLWRGLDQT